MNAYTHPQDHIGNSLLDFSFTPDGSGIYTQSLSNCPVGESKPGETVKAVNNPTEVISTFWTEVSHALDCDVDEAQLICSWAKANDIKIRTLFSGYGDTSVGSRSYDICECGKPAPVHGVCQFCGAEHNPEDFAPYGLEEV